MSPAFHISLSIWARTLLFNIIIIGCYAFYLEGFEAIFSLGLMLIGAFITTLPLLSVINPLVKWMASISYSPGSRLASLGFLLILLAMAFYAVGGLLVWFVSGTEMFTDKNMHLLLASTISAIIIATWSVKTSFIKLNPGNHEEQLV